MDLAETLREIETYPSRSELTEQGWGVVSILDVRPGMELGYKRYKVLRVERRPGPGRFEVWFEVDPENPRVFTSDQTFLCPPDSLP